MKPSVLCVPRRLEIVAHELEPAYDIHRYWLLAEEDHDAFLAGPGAQVRAIVLGGAYAPPTPFLERMKALELIVCVSVGYEKIDVEWCRLHGVAVCTGQGANAGDVADQGLALALAARRRLLWSDALVRSGGWVIDGQPRSRSMSTARVGIVGMGAIGQALALRLAPTGCHLAWWGPRPKPELPYPRAESLTALAKHSDILVVASRADDTTRGIIDREVIAALGPDGVLVNIARGFLVDEDALIEALKSGALGGAALDVFIDEPTPPQRWEGVPNVILNSHMGGSTVESIGLLWGQAKANLNRWFAGEPLLTPIAETLPQPAAVSRP